MTSVPTLSPFNALTAPPPPVILLLSLTDIVASPSVTLAAHTNLPSRLIKRDPSSGPTRLRTPRISSLSRSTSSPLSSRRSASTSAEPQSPAASASAPAFNGTAIPRPTGAQLSARAWKDLVPAQLAKEIEARIKVLGPSILDPTKSFTKQNVGAVNKFEAQLVSEYPDLRNFIDHWPVQVFTTSWLKYMGTRKPKAPSTST
ncbi:hypothetical protein C8R47DRAFT_1224346 [Mycena vitilis]|nr:hypothetical protein C8R47DRAFT_1231174 [Mycena vitilis]KAJ6457854.1 hypothetical protein C8R47DRAFT_1081909 [Mycena vitilis]KAJ6465656.1 hypothetical protein C8R47DRAFT_1224346 [Mycena vitilis]